MKWQIYTLLAGHIVLVLAYTHYCIAWLNLRKFHRAYERFGHGSYLELVRAAISFMEDVDTPGARRATIVMIIEAEKAQYSFFRDEIRRDLNQARRSIITHTCLYLIFAAGLPIFEILIVKSIFVRIAF